MNPEYKAYLLSTEWKAFKRKALIYHGNKCSKCHRTKNLHVHHLTYVNIFHEDLKDVVLLCPGHHRKAHGLLTKKEKKLKKDKTATKKANKKSIQYLVIKYTKYENTREKKRLRK